MTSTSSFNASSSPSQKFKFLKKGSSELYPRSAGLHRLTPQFFHATGSQSKASPGLGDDYFESKPTPDALVRQLGQSLSHLKAQHDQLTSLIPALAASLLRQEQLHQFQQQQHHLQLTRPSSALANLPHSSRYPSRAHSTAYGGNGSIHGGSRASSFSMASEETEEYYEDARTGIPGEFFLKEEEEDREKVLEEEDEGEEDDEYGDDEEIYEEDAYEEDETRKIQDEVEARGAVGDQSTTMMVERRKALPAPASGEEFSMLGMLRKNVGKVGDLPTNRLSRCRSQLLTFVPSDRPIRIYPPSRSLSPSTSLSLHCNESLRNWNTRNYCIELRKKPIRSSDWYWWLRSLSRELSVTSSGVVESLCESSCFLSCIYRPSLNHASCSFVPFAVIHCWGRRMNVFDLTKVSGSAR